MQLKINTKNAAIIAVNILLMLYCFATSLHIGPQLSAFQPVTIDEVRKLLTSMPCKTSPLYVLPCSLLKDCADVFALVITRLADMSLQVGRFPAWFKSAQVLPLLKKAGLDRLSPTNYSIGPSPNC